MAFCNPKPVRQCCCYPHSFAEIKRLVDEYNWRTIEQIGDALGCGTGCGMCRPYLARLLGTGETAFAVMTEAEAEKELSVTTEANRRQNTQ